MNEEKIQQIKNALLQLFQSIQESGEEITDEIEGMLVQVMEHVADRIKQLRNEEPVENLEPQIPQVPSSEYPSSNVNGLKYDPKKQEMYLQFHGPYPQSAGPVYKYSGVPKFIFDVISRGAVAPKTSGKNRYHQWFKGITPSLGASVNSLLKAGAYPYSRIS